MSRRIHGGGIAAALVLALTLATPAHAAGLKGGWDPASELLLRAWHWLTGGWEAPVGRQGRAGRPTTKEGLGIDPQGGHSLGTGSTTGSTVPSGGGTVGSSGG
jgi:hypothetical protein